MWLFQTTSKTSLTLLLARFLHLGSTDGKYSLVWDVLAKDGQLDACLGESIKQHTYQLWATVNFNKERLKISYLNSVQELGSVFSLFFCSYMIKTNMVQHVYHQFFH